MARKIYAFAVLMALVLSSFAFSVSAERESLTASYKIPSDSISISFTSSADTANVIIADRDSSLNIDTTEFALIRELEKGEDDNFSLNALMPDESSSGKYYVIVTDEGGARLTDSFWYMSETQAQTALDALSNATKETFSGLINTHSTDLGIDVDEFNENAAEITAAYIANKPAEVNKKSFLTAYSYAVLFGSTKGVENLDDIEEIFEEKANNIGLDMTAYNSLDSIAKQEILEKLSKGEYKKGNPDEVINQWICLADINNAENDSVDNFKNLLFEKYDSVLELDTTDYDDADNKNDIILEIIKGRPYDSKEDLIKAFSDAVEKITEEEKEDNNRGGGGGGGGKVTSQMGIAASPALNDAKFSDVPENHWAYNQIKTLCEKGIVSGKETGKFYPEDNITRAEFSKIISQTFFADSMVYEIAFDDVNQNAWYYEYVAKLAGQGIIMGDENGLFNPNAPITRQDAAVIINRVCEKKGLYLTALRENIIFDDEKNIGGYAQEAIDKLYSAGIINGMENNAFMPLNNLTRAQGVQLIYVTMLNR